MVKKILKIISYTLLGIIAFALILSFVLWAVIPVYNFPEEQKFSGDKFYNPYKDYDNTHYYRANFHGHSRLTGGLTNGKDNSLEDVFKAYRDLEYGYATVSNYHHITPESFYDFPLIPAQEYGVNVFKTHLLLIGSTRKEYYDQPLLQDANTIQFRINMVKPHTNIVTLAHPAFLNGIEVEHMKKLTGYDLMEVVNTFAHSVTHWDTALTSGRPAFLLASDDTHNVFINTDIGRNITMIPLEPSKYELVYDTLKQGSAYGITVPHSIAALNRDEKLKVLESHPQLISLQVDDNGLINIKLNRNVDKITFTSDNGVEKAAFENTDNASYKFMNDESYIRATAYFDNESIAYFNPVIRTSDGLKPNMPEISLNYPLTIIKYLFSIILAACIVYGLWYITMKRKRN